MDKDKAGSGSIVGIDENRTAEDDGNLVTDCQSESGAFFLAEFFESIEDLSLFVGRNAGTGIGDRKDDLPLIFLHFESEGD